MLATNIRTARLAAKLPPLTYVFTMSRPTDDPMPELEQARDDLREAIEHSRELVRRSRFLLELSECERAVPANDNEREFTD